MSDFTSFCEKYQLTLTADQGKAVTEAGGAILLLATPGSGKTTVLVARAGYLINVCNIPADNILTMTYTTAATRDMAQRYKSVFFDNLQLPEFRTINGVSYSINRYFEQHYHRVQPALLSQEKERAHLITQIYQQICQEYPGENTVSAIGQLITYIKNMMLNEQEIELLNTEELDIPRLYSEYQRQLKENNLMDYDDQMVFAHQILSKFPQVRRHFSDKYRYICVDEAQDTSRIQHEIIRLLVGENGNIFMVGDEDQSIYGFRAAYPKALLGFSDNYSNAKILMIRENFRSNEEIVTAAQRFINLNQNRYSKTMYSNKGKGGTVKEIRLNNRSEQFDYLAKIGSDSVSRSDATAVLYRDSFTMAALVDILERRNIPYFLQQSDTSFFTHKVVLDIRDIITLAYNPKDADTFCRVYYKLGAYLSEKAITNAIAQSRALDIPIISYLTQPDSGISDYSRKQCAKIGAGLEKLTTLDAAGAIELIISQIGYKKYLKEKNTDDRRLSVLKIMARHEATPAGLLSRLERLKQLISEHQNPENPALILSTVHSAKGLEYDNVYLADVIDGIFPADNNYSKAETDKPGKSRQQDKPGGKADKAIKAIEKQADFMDNNTSDIEEERRLFYVAMTRARKNLYIFTFIAGNLASEFSSFLFPAPQRPKKKIALEKPPLRTKPVPADDPRLKAFAVGVVIRHKVFGTGTIISRSGDILIAEFETVGSKKLALSGAFSAGLLEVVG